MRRRTVRGGRGKRERAEAQADGWRLKGVHQQLVPP